MTGLLGDKLNEYRYSRMWRKTKHQILTSKFDHWVIPMEREGHFMTIHIDFKQLIMKYYDPLYPIDICIIDILKKFLGDLKTDGLSFNPEEFKIVEANAPKQQNGIDCGVIALMIAECILAEENIVQNFKQCEIDHHRKVLSEYLIYMISTEKEVFERESFNVFCRIKKTFGTNSLPNSKEKEKQKVSSLEDSFEKEMSLLDNSDEEETLESPTKRRKVEDLKFDERFSDESNCEYEQFSFKNIGTLSNNEVHNDSFINDESDDDDNTSQSPGKSKKRKEKNTSKKKCSNCNLPGHNSRTCKK